MDAKQQAIVKRFLAKYVPDLAWEGKFVDYRDNYIPFSETHPLLRIRKAGNVLEMTKIIPATIAGTQPQEITIPLSQLEYDELQSVRGNVVVKQRYFLPVGQRIGAVDVYFDKLSGLAVIEFSFTSEQDATSFVLPDYCLAEITQTEIASDNYLAGKLYQDISFALEKYGYKPIQLKQ